MNKRHSALLMRTYVIMVFCFMYLPIAVMIAFSFNESKSRSNFTGFTLVPAKGEACEVGTRASPVPTSQASPLAGTRACSTMR